MNSPTTPPQFSTLGLLHGVTVDVEGHCGGPVGMGRSEGREGLTSSHPPHGTSASALPL